MKLVRRLSALFAFSLSMSCFNVASGPPWPTGPRADRANASIANSEIVQRLPVCVAAEAWSAGEIGRTVLYRSERHGRTMTVGYFVYWTTERPWGKNALSYSLVPALFIDAFYSHLFFMFPGFQRILHGPGDIEGARVVYEQQGDGRWKPVSAVADDGLHRDVNLSIADFVDDEGRVVLMTDVWSHQLGARGARGFASREKDAIVCYEGDAIAPLTDEIARAFRLGSPSDPRRARPAWETDRPAAVADATPASPMLGAVVPR